MIPEDKIRKEIRLSNIFWPYGMQQRREFYKQPGNGENPSAEFVHYTSAENALQIIKSKRMWMRNTMCMSDYREVRHGFDIINEFFRKDVKAFENTLDNCVPGAFSEAIKLFNGWWRDIQLNTYIASISEHIASEDKTGRLSMWRAFGGSNPKVAIVLKIPWVMESDSRRNLVLSPVAYLPEEDVHKEFTSIIGNIRDNREFLISLKKEEVVTAVFHTLLSCVLCLKHEGFREEREWRIVYSAGWAQPPLLESSLETILGVPQKIYKISLETDEQNTNDLALPRLFGRLIIGPSQYQLSMQEAFISALREAKVESPESKVHLSNIPIRT